MKTALVTGISGQDGSYMAELLLKQSYRVVGAVRDVDQARRKLPIELVDRIDLVEWNMSSQAQMAKTLGKVAPAEIYNFAAYSSGSGMYDGAVELCDLNGLAVLRILEAIREVDSRIRFCQASSREVFGEPSESPQTELTIRNPRSPYGVAKLFADASIAIYRERYALFAASAILFNHESPRRRPEFVSRKVTQQAAKIKSGLAKDLRLGNLDARRDWGFAGDYVKAMWLMLQHTDPDDYVICTGESHSVRELCEQAFERLGLDYRDYVQEDEKSYRPNEPALLVGDATKAKNDLGWAPETSFAALVNMMVDSDLLQNTERE